LGASSGWTVVGGSVLPETLDTLLGRGVARARPRIPAGHRGTRPLVGWRSRRTRYRGRHSARGGASKHPCPTVPQSSAQRGRGELGCQPKPDAEYRGLQSFQPEPRVAGCLHHVVQAQGRHPVPKVDRPAVALVTAHPACCRVPGPASSFRASCGWIRKVASAGVPHWPRLQPRPRSGTAVAGGSAKPRLGVGDLAQPAAVQPGYQLLEGLRALAGGYPDNPDEVPTRQAWRGGDLEAARNSATAALIAYRWSYRPVVGCGDGGAAVSYRDPRGGMAG